MKDNVMFKVIQPPVIKGIDKSLLRNGWKMLKQEYGATRIEFTYGKEVYANPTDEYTSLACITYGEWLDTSTSGTRFFIRTSNNTKQGKLHKLSLYKSVKEKLETIIDEVDQFYTENNYEEKYPDIQRYGKKPFEYEYEQMSNEEKSEYPRKIHFV